MAKFRCPRPVNRLVHMNTRGMSGPFFQNTGNACIHTAGNARAPGGPLSGPKALNGIVEDPGTIVKVVFSQCVELANTPPYTGIEIQIDGGAWETVLGATVDPVDGIFIKFTVQTTIGPGDEVRWRYVGDSGRIVDCADSEDIGDQNIPVINPLVLAGDFILLETGGSNIILLEDDSTQQDGIQLETAP